MSLYWSLNAFLCSLSCCLRYFLRIFRSSLLFDGPSRVDSVLCRLVAMLERAVGMSVRIRLSSFLVSFIGFFLEVVAACFDSASALPGCVVFWGESHF